MTRTEFANEFRRLAEGFGVPEPHRNRMEALWTQFRSLPLAGVKRGIDLALQGDRYPSAAFLRKCLEDGAAFTPAEATNGLRFPGGFDEFGSWKADSPGSDPFSRFVRYVVERKRADSLSPSEVAALLEQHPEFLEPFRVALPDWEARRTYAEWQGAARMNSAQAAVVTCGQAIPTWSLPDPEPWRRACNRAAARDGYPDLSRAQWEKLANSKASAFPAQEAMW